MTIDSETQCGGCGEVPGCHCSFGSCTCVDGVARSRTDRLLAAREGVVKALEDALTYYIVCNCDDRCTGTCAYAEGNAALKELEEANK